jgi:hypothetical protein
MSEKEEYEKVPSWSKKKKKLSPAILIVVVTIGIVLVGLIAFALIMRYKIKRTIFQPKSTLLPNSSTLTAADNSHPNQSSSSAKPNNPSHPTYQPKSGDLFLTRYIRKRDRDDRYKIPKYSNEDNNRENVSSGGAPNMSTILQTIASDKHHWTHAGVVASDPNDPMKIYLVDITRKGLACVTLRDYVHALGEYEELAIWPLNKPLHLKLWHLSVTTLFTVMPKYDLKVVFRMLRRCKKSAFSQNQQPVQRFKHGRAKKSQQSDSQTTEYSDDDDQYNDYRTPDVDQENHRQQKKSSAVLHPSDAGYYLQQPAQTCSSIVISLWYASNLIDLTPSKDGVKIDRTNAMSVFAHELISEGIVWNDGYKLLPCVWVKRCSNIV